MASPELKEPFFEIVDGSTSLVAMEADEIFCQGFRMGARLMLELFEKE